MMWSICGRYSRGKCKFWRVTNDKSATESTEDTEGVLSKHGTQNSKVQAQNRSPKPQTGISCAMWGLWGFGFWFWPLRSTFWVSQLTSVLSVSSVAEVVLSLICGSMQCDSVKGVETV